MASRRMPLPPTIDIGPYTIHVAVAVARLRRNQHRVRISLTVVVIAMMLVTSGIAGIRWLRGTGTIQLTAMPPATTIFLNGRPLTQPAITVPAGTHTLTVQRTPSLAVTFPITVTRDQTQTITLPRLPPLPAVTPLRLPIATGTWEHIAPDPASGWTLTLLLPPAESDSPRRSVPRPNQAKEEPARWTFRLDATGLVRVETGSTPHVESILASGERRWARWEPVIATTTAGQTGTLLIATATTTHILPTTVHITRLWWNPTGDMLLVAWQPAGTSTRSTATPVPTTISMLSLAGIGSESAAAQPPIPDQITAQTIPSLVTTLGSIEAVNWSPDGTAAVVMVRIASGSAPRANEPTDGNLAPLATGWNRMAFLVRQANDTQQVLQLPTPLSLPYGLVAMLWDRTAPILWWGSDTGMGYALAAITIPTGVIERVRTLPSDLVGILPSPTTAPALLRRHTDGRLWIEGWGGPAYHLDLTDLNIPGSTAAGEVGGMADAAGTTAIIASSPTSYWVLDLPRAEVDP